MPVCSGAFVGYSDLASAAIGTRVSSRRIMFFSWASTAATRTQQAADSPRSHEIDDPFVPGDVALKADLLQLFGHRTRQDASETFGTYRNAHWDPHLIHIRALGETRDANIDIHAMARCDARA